MTQNEAKPLIVAEWDRHPKGSHDATTFYIYLTEEKSELLDFRVATNDKYECIKSWLCEAGRIKLFQQGD